MNRAFTLLLVLVGSLVVSTSSFASNMGKTAHLRHGLQDLEKAMIDVEQAKGDGTPEFEDHRKKMISLIRDAEEEVRATEKYRAAHGLRDE